ncbi:MAG: HAD-IIIA family hydrolase [Enterocloster clostridioformis]
MERVVFLDQDGTLNEGSTLSARDFRAEAPSGSAEALRMLREAGYRLVVVTNQAGVARGYYGEEDVRNLHVYMNHILEGQGVH